jgi:hypothetical protein
MFTLEPLIIQRPNNSTLVWRIGRGKLKIVWKHSELVSKCVESSDFIRKEKSTADESRYTTGVQLIRAPINP